MKKTVFIKNEGCAIRPHGSIWEVEDKGGNEYWVGSDRFPKTWAEEFPFGALVDFQNPTFTTKKYDWNKFRTLGYITGSNEKTNYFTPKEYQEFEEYSAKNNLNINKYD